MSVKLMSAVWAVDLSLPEKLVLLALADSANDEGMCWPSVTSLYKKCSLSERAVRQAVGSLEAKGHLTIHQRTGRSNYYTVHPLHDVHPCTECTPAPDAPTPAPDAPPPLHTVHLTPAPRAPITIIEPSSEPSRNQREARAPRSARATRLPEDFRLTPERRAIAETQKADPDREFAQFVDHFRAAPGEKGRKNDWDATWRNWCRRAPDFKPRPRFTTGHPEDTGWRPPEARR